jgi:3-oxoacyl-[acyl-carrier protein] reductase
MSAHRTVLITGATGGLGGALARRFAAAGWRIGLGYHTARATAAALAAEIGAAGGEALAVAADVRARAAVETMVAAVCERFERLDVVIHAAGGTRDDLLQRMPPDAFTDVVAAHLTGGFHLLRAAAAPMAKSGGGQILFVLSAAAFGGRAGQANYAAAKAGLAGLIRSAARELGRDNLRVNGIVPGFLSTPLTAAVAETAAAAIRARNTLGRPSTLEEVAEISLAIAASRHVSGQIFHLDSCIE